MSSKVVPVRINTFLKQKESSYVDCLSKFFIICECALGLNRLPLLGIKINRLIKFLAVSYSLLVLIALIYLTYHFYDFTLIQSLGFIEYIFCVTFSYVTWKRTERYYTELSKFDNEFGCRPMIAAVSINNLVLMIIFTTVITVFHVLCIYYERFDNVYLTFVPLNIIHSLEMFYYGHLLSLLIPNFRLINYYLESSLATNKRVVRPKIREFPSFKYKNSTNNRVDKLMDMYHIIIKSYDYLIDAIKWQLLVVLITSFCITLYFCYHMSLSIIRDENPFLNIMSDTGMSAAEMLPLFSVCVFGDRVHGEVRRLRELLASRLYENNLDKPGRSAARALLALTEARDLSFSLLRMLQIDISLPFKFIGLLVTYLIILLQFDKVIHSTPAST